MCQQSDHEKLTGKVSLASFRHYTGIFLAGQGKKHENPQSTEPVIWLRFKPCTNQIQVLSITVTPICLATLLLVCIFPTAEETCNWTPAHYNGYILTRSWVQAQAVVRLFNWFWF